MEKHIERVLRLQRVLLTYAQKAPDVMLQSLALSLNDAPLYSFKLTSSALLPHGRRARDRFFCGLATWLKTNFQLEAQAVLIADDVSLIALVEHDRKTDSRHAPRSWIEIFDAPNEARWNAPGIGRSLKGCDKHHLVRNRRPAIYAVIYGSILGQDGSFYPSDISVLGIDHFCPDDGKCLSTPLTEIDSLAHTRTHNVSKALYALALIYREGLRDTTRIDIRSG